MAVSKGWKIAIGALIIIALLIVVAPFVARAQIKSKIDEKLQNEFGDLAHYDSININWSPLGATLINLRLGEINPHAGNQPVINIGNTDIVLHSLFDSEPRVATLTANDLTVNIFVDEKGESSLAKLVREKKRSSRTKPITIDALAINNISITTYVAPHNGSTAESTQPGQPGQPAQTSQPTQPGQTGQPNHTAQAGQVAGTEANPPSQNAPTTRVLTDQNGATVVVPVTQPATSSAPSSAAPNSSATPAVGADSTLKVATVRATGFIVPIPGQLLGHEQWIPTVIENLDAYGIAKTNGGSSAPATPALHINRISFELDQAENTESPVRIRSFKAEQSKCTTSSDLHDKSGLRHVVASIQKGLGLKEPPEIRNASGKPPAPQGTGLLIHDFESDNALIEITGAGNSAFWRLNGAQIQAGNLVFGDKIDSKELGYLKIQSPTESSSIPGHVDLSITDLSGSYPQSTFKCSYHIENVAATAFSNMAEKAQQVEVRRGTLSLSFAGGANQGQLGIEGSVTLSSDFEISGSAMKSTGVELIRGSPIDHVTIDGTLEHPQVHLPKELALLGELMGNIIGGGPLGIVNATAGQIPVIGPVVKETTKAGSKVLGKIPVIGELFKGGDKDKNKE